LNISDGSLFTWGKLWPQLAAAYGAEYGVPQTDDAVFTTVIMPIAPPPRGFGPAGKFRLSWSWEAWAGKEENIQAWKRIKEREELVAVRDPFATENVKDIFGLLDAAILGPWGRSMR
jgi:hypothetical protein